MSTEQEIKRFTLGAESHAYRLRGPQYCIGAELAGAYQSAEGAPMTQLRVCCAALGLSTRIGDKLVETRNGLYVFEHMDGASILAFGRRVYDYLKSEKHEEQAIITAAYEAFQEILKRTYSVTETEVASRADFFVRGEAG